MPVASSTRMEGHRDHLTSTLTGPGSGAPPRSVVNGPGSSGHCPVGGVASAIVVACSTPAVGPGTGRTAVMTGLVLAYGAASQRLVPPRATVPANLTAAAGAVLLARRFGCTWAELGLDPAQLATGLGGGV